ncbi:MAG: hypothetical protein RBU37_16430 [Myxococcota bacterium]|jgi:hypothetical protein|nr:hypothetical protein [Myxococcota bacterium]
MRLISTRLLVILSALCFAFLACGEDDPPKTDQSELDTTDQELDVEPDIELEEESDIEELEPELELVEDEALEDELEEPEDTFEVYTDPVVFALVQLDTELREVLYMRGGNAIAMPDMRIKAESISRTPIAGQLIGFIYPFPGSHAQPSQSWTNQEGLTDVLELTLVADTFEDTARFLLTPYIIGTEPNPLAEKKVDGLAVDVELHYPQDELGEPIPFIGDGSTHYPVRVSLARADGKDLLSELEVEIELVLSGGTSPISVDGENSKRFPVDVETGELNLEFISTREGADTAIFFLRFYQKGARRGQKTITLELLAP